MAFLDNSGDIILDAVLTDLGRRKMARGSFEISKFALGDDEINYETYDRNHPSGSAYFDLEILQTPVMEAVTGIAAHINYGLLSIPNPNLLYMPVMKENNKVTLAADRRDNVFYLTQPGETADALIAAFGGATGGGDLKVLQSGQRSGTKIIIETGLDTSRIAGTPSNRTNYITSTGLTDATFQVSYDARFFTSVMGPAGASSFSTTAGTGASNIRFNLTSTAGTTRDRSVRRHVLANIRAVANNVVKRSEDTRADTATSVIAGPRANVTALNFVTKLFSDDDYVRFGKIGQTITGASGTYKFIDTSVKVMSAVAGTYHLPIRIIKKE